MIEAIQAEINAAVHNLGAGNEQVNQGVKRAEDVASALSTINAGVQSTLACINDIARATGGHEAAGTHVAGSIARIAQMAEQNAVVMLQAAQDVLEVEQIAAKLHTEAGWFKAGL